jgi:putative transposase
MLRISRQAVYQYARRQHEHRVDEEKIVHEVRLIRRQMPRIGTRKLYEQLQPMLGAQSIGRDGFFDILRRHRMLIKPRRRFVPTTNSRHALPVCPNLLKAGPPEGPGRVIVADQTYLRLENGFCYLSLVTDLWSRKILGVDVHPTLEAIGPLRAIAMALKDLKHRDRFIHHSDRGVQYCSSEYRAFIESHAGTRSMSAAGCPYENAVAERVNGILKSEFYLDKTFASLDQARNADLEAVAVYNNQRPHLSLGMQTPAMRYAA